VNMWVASCVRCGRKARVETSDEKVLGEIRRLWLERHAQRCEAAPVEGREDA
jgi:hypothetical protein